MAAPWRGVFPGTWQPSDAAFNTPPSILVKDAMLGASAVASSDLSLSSTEGADTLSASFSVSSASSDLSLSATEGADLVSANTGLVISGALSATEGADSLASNVGSVVSAGLAVTDGADSLASNVTELISINLSATDGADSVSSSVGLAIMANLAATDGADTAASNVIELIVASISAIDGADTATAGMEVVAGQASLALDATEGADQANAGVDHPREPEVVFSGAGGLGAYLSLKKKREALERRLRELKKQKEEEEEKQVGVEYHPTELDFTPFEQKIQVFTIHEPRTEVNTEPIRKPRKVATKKPETPKPIKFRPIQTVKKDPPKPSKPKWDYNKLMQIIELMEAM